MSPNDEELVYAEEDPETGWDLWALPLNEDRKTPTVGFTGWMRTGPARPND